MRKDWALISIISLIILVGLGLVGYLKLSKKSILANPTGSNQGVAGSTTASPSYFSENATVLYFYTDTCHWCIKEKDVLAELGKEGYQVKPMNLGEKPELASQYKVTGTPTFIAKNGEGERQAGFLDKDPLKAWLDKNK